MIKLCSVQGNYQEVLRLRSLALNGKRTKHNKLEFKEGLRLLTPSLKLALENKNQVRLMEDRKRMNNSHNDDYIKYLEGRRK